MKKHQQHKDHHDHNEHHDHHDHNEHSAKNHHAESPLTNSKIEYCKFGLVIFAIFTLSTVHSSIVGMTVQQFLESFMGVFFFVFSIFKLSSLKEFAYGFQSYDLIAKKSLFYSFSYPFIQLILGFIYLLGLNNAGVDVFVVLISLVSGLGVLLSLKKGNKIHCVCLGNVIKLPLSTISFVEDFGMAIMAITMLLMF